MSKCGILTCLNRGDLKPVSEAYRLMFKISSQFSYFPLHMFCFSSQKVKEAAFSFFNVFKCKIYFSKTNIQFSTNISSVKEKRLTEKRSNLLIRQSRPYFLLTSDNLIITGSPGDYDSKEGF